MDPDDEAQPDRGRHRRQRKVRRAGVQAVGRQVRRQAGLLPRLFRHHQEGRHDLQPAHPPRRARRPPDPDPGRPAQGHRRLLRRRHRRDGRHQERHHRRHAWPPTTTTSCSSRRPSPSRSSRMAVEPKTKADQEKLAQRARSRLSEEDPTFMVKTDEETGQTIISGMGELHLEIIVDRIKREFKVEANTGTPQIAYRETITKAAGGEGKLVKQIRRPRPVRPRRSSRSSPTKAARASPSRTRSSAARSPRNSSTPSSRASTRP